MKFFITDPAYNQRSGFYLWPLLFIAAVLIFVGLGLREPWPADEPRFAQIAKEMVETGQWFFPARAQEFYPDKPPVFMWFIAIFYAITGSLILAFLLPSALCSLLTVYLVFDLGRKLWSPQIGMAAGFLLVFSFQFMLQAKSAQIDAMVSCWITMGCYGLLRFMLYDGRWRGYYLAWFFMGLGVITKGVGFLPLFMLLPYFTFRIRAPHKLTVRPQHESIGRWLLGPAVMLLAIGLWLVPMLIIVGLSENPLLTLYRDNILFRQTVTRYADSWHHIKPFWYYLVSVIPVFWLPLSLAMPWLIPQWLQAIKKADARIILPLAWIVLVLLFFSLSPGKRGVYILPALPMLALVSAPYFQMLSQVRALNKLVFSTVVLISSSLLLLGLCGIAQLSFATSLETRFDVAPWNLFVVLGGCGCAFSFFCFNRTQWHSWPLFIGLLWLLYSTWGYTLLADVKTPHKIYREVSERVPNDAEIALVNFSEQFILFSPFPITHFGYHTENQQQMRAAYQWQSQSTKRYILLDYTLLKNQCYDQEKAIHLGFAHRTDWVLLSTQSRRNRCPEPDPSVIQYHYQAVKQ